MKCNNRFQKPVIQKFEIEEGIFAEKPICPKCNSDKIVTSSIGMK